MDHPANDSMPAPTNPRPLDIETGAHPPALILTRATAHDTAHWYLSELPFVRHCLRRLGVRSQDQGDLAQEVFTRAFQALIGTVVQAHVVRPWLKAIVFRVTMEFRRRWTREAHVSLLAPTPEDPPLADALLSRRQLTGLVHAAVERIAVSRRRLFIMFEIEGLSMPVIAATLSIPLNTAYSRLRLARKEFAVEAQRLGLSLGRGPSQDPTSDP